MADQRAAAATSRPPRAVRLDPNAKVVRVRHYGRGALAIFVAAATAYVLWALATNPKVLWSVVGEFLLSPAIMRGLGITLAMTALAVVFGVVIAVAVAVMRLSRSYVLRGVSFGYVFLFRGIPLIVLLILVGNLGLFIPTISFGIPFTDVTLFSAPVKSVVTPFVASVIGLTLTTSAYMSEIVRGGLLSVSRGQYAAAMALGLNRGQTLRRIVIPQAMRVIVPPLGNEFITTLKMSALVSVIAGGDLLTVAMGIAGVNYRTIELLFVATFWYLVVIVVYSVIQYFVERRTAER